MNKKHFIIPTTITFIVVSLIAFLIPIEIKNIASFIIIDISYILYNIVSMFIITDNIKNEFKKEIPSLSIFYIFGLFNLFLIILLFVSKCTDLSMNISLIILLTILLIYALILYALLNARKTINKKEIEIKQKIKNVKQWRTKIQILVENNKDDKELLKLYEILEYMDPTSIEETQSLDEKIENEIDNVVNNRNKESIEKVIKLLNERIVILKNNK